MSLHVGEPTIAAPLNHVLMYIQATPFTVSTLRAYNQKPKIAILTGIRDCLCQITKDRTDSRMSGNGNLQYHHAMDEA